MGVLVYTNDNTNSNNNMYLKSTLNYNYTAHECTLT